jgi:hypothetical protein
MHLGSFSKDPITKGRQMTQIMLTMIASTLVANPALPEERVVLPKSAPPEFVLVSGVDKEKGVFNIQTSVAVPVTVTNTRIIEINGMNVPQTVTVIEYHSTKEESRNLADFRVLDAQGKELEGDAGWKKLADDKLVVRQAGPKPIDPAYLKLFAKDTLILAPKAEK